CAASGTRSAPRRRTRPTRRAGSTPGSSATTSRSSPRRAGSPSAPCTRTSRARTSATCSGSTPVRRPGVGAWGGSSCAPSPASCARRVASGSCSASTPRTRRHGRSTSDSGSRTPRACSAPGSTACSATRMPAMAVAEQSLRELRGARLAEVDPEIAELIGRELERQRGQIELIASENFTWPSILEAAASVPTNKYAEGYPGRRYYGGCEVVDEIEQLAIDRAKELFGAEHANVQPHAGAQTNMAVYSAVLDPGDTILSLRLDHGGHLTHGLKVNFSGRLYSIVHYGVSKQTYKVDYHQVRRLAHEHHPRLIVCGGSAYPRTVEADRFREIADEVGAYLLCDM